MTENTIQKQLTSCLPTIAVAVGLDPAGLELVAYDDGVATLKLGEACASCPATIPLLVAQLEAELRRDVPEVQIVEVVQ